MGLMTVADARLEASSGDGAAAGIVAHLDETQPSTCFPATAEEVDLKSILG